jgi:hypothetical protein
MPRLLILFVSCLCIICFIILYGNSPANNNIPTFQIQSKQWYYFDNDLDNFQSTECICNATLTRNEDKVTLAIDAYYYGKHPSKGPQAIYSTSIKDGGFFYITRLYEVLSDKWNFWVIIPDEQALLDNGKLGLILHITK